MRQIDAEGAEMRTQERPGRNIATKPPSSMMARKQLPDLLAKAGYPTTLSAINQLSCTGKGPPIAQRWGFETYYVPRDVVAWARKRAAKYRRNDTAINNLLGYLATLTKEDRSRISNLGLQARLRNKEARKKIDNGA